MIAEITLGTFYRSKGFLSYPEWGTGGVNFEPEAGIEAGNSIGTAGCHVYLQRAREVNLAR
jgi:hypothetical protein